ncbi:response regulator [Cohnella fermenti]|uniref:response regulator n=1 Tax=Cohnella fermenti TaxID=2565925 RepID=UPI001454D1EB|nr:response regulator [Cohnella fermenti]
MWTIYLVEDEAFVRQAIREILEWETHGFRVVGEAGTGKDALADIRALRPDVVICDIVMPGMDGIELLRLVREEGIPCRFIMLTAMSDFDYARNALQYGATNYLLKLSLSDDILLANLSRIKGELISELERKGEALHPFYYQAWAELRRQAGLTDPAGKPSAVPDDFRALHLTVYTVLNGSAPITWEQLMEADIVSNEQYVAVHSFTEAGETAFFCWSKQASGELLRAGKAGELCAAAAGGGSLDSLTQHWGLALGQLDPCWYEGDSARESGPEPPMRELEGELVRCFEERHETKCLELLDSLWRGMDAERYGHIEVKMTAVRLAGMMTTLARGRGEPQVAELLAERTHRQLLQTMKRWVAELLRRLNEEEGLFTDHPDVNRVIRHMLENYRENVTVKDMAKLAAMNVDYLSTLFRRKTGQTPVAFLQNIRIGHAKRLLRTTEWSVVEVADRTGFADDAYFIKLFKREVGQTPSAYRKAQAISDLSY